MYKVAIGMVEGLLRVSHCKHWTPGQKGAIGGIVGEEAARGAVKPGNPEVDRSKEGKMELSERDVDVLRRCLEDLLFEMLNKVDKSAVERLGTTAISSVSKAEHFSQTFAKNSTLDDSGLVPPSPPLSDYFMSSIKILHNDIFHALSGLNPQKAYGPIVLKIVLLCLHLAWPNSFNFVY
ncbi:hypothetical protein E2C01_059523 [Portunus trituberculatus]|uniref:Uncharacterized protein n=1 Tax=Portunus trituberculatus TaxID=210409 RepID=A0A5B7H6B1_PORTR|nr:hypothetical protein [Portunus trituberculatus]